MLQCGTAHEPACCVICRLSVLHRHRLGTTAAQSYPAMFAKVGCATAWTGTRFGWFWEMLQPARYHR